MIRSWLLVWLALAAGAAVAYYLRADTGYVLIHYRGWSVETSVLALLALVLLGAPLTLYALRALLGLFRLPALLILIGGRRRAERARDSFESGLLKLLEGHWQQAEIELIRRAADHRASHLNYLAAARAAQRLGAADRRDHYLELAARDAPQLAFATGLTQAELQRERGEFGLAKATALKLHEAEPLQPYPVELLAECHYARGEWAELHGLLTRTEKLGAPPPERRRELLHRALRERLHAAVAEARLDALKQLWQQVPSGLKNDPVLRLEYASGLARLNAHAEASALIASALATQWDADLANLYGQLHAADPLGQLASIEQWLNQYGEKPELLITAGRACLANKLWGKARSYLEAVIRVNPSPAAYLELARLAEQTQNGDEAAKLHRQGLELASR
ncbi:MAG: heme biosynthesis protein HemY [Panacagrimonas sp.]